MTKCLPDADMGNHELTRMVLADASPCLPDAKEEPLILLIVRMWPC